MKLKPVFDKIQRLTEYQTSYPVITSIVMDNGQIVDEPEQIAKLALNLYQELLHTAKG